MENQTETEFGTTCSAKPRHRVTPCEACPWKIGADSADIPGFDEHKARTDLPMVNEDRGLSSTVMACHLSTEEDSKVCAGYALSETGYHNLSLRMLIIRGGYDIEAVAKASAGFELHNTFEEMLTALLGDDDWMEDDDDDDYDYDYE